MIKEKNKISVVMPAYNAENTIVDSIQSVLSQTYQNFELIIIDDGSKDSTFDVVNNSFSDSKIIIKQIKNSGIANARNIAMKLATGNFIAFLDSDDIWDIEFLSTCIEIFDKKDDIDIVYTFYKIFKTDIHQNIQGLQNRYKFIRNNFYRIMIYDYIPTSAAMIKRSVALDGNGFDKNYYGTEDWDFWIRKISQHSIYFVQEPLSYYREHDLGISKNKRRQTDNHYKVVLHTLNTYSIPFWVRYLILWEIHRCLILTHFSVGSYGVACFEMFKLIIKNPLFIPSYLFLFHALYRRQKLRDLK
jgi:glycosyltransferase involved in cell wall biosynthesis